MPTEPPAPPPVPASLRPGRKLGPIVESAGSAHRAWLEPVRSKYLGSGLTLNELSLRIRLSKSKLSELLRGTGLYPRWEIILSLSVELNMPQWPLHRLWRQAAVEAHKSREWINRCIRRTATASHDEPPLPHRAFRELVEGDYTLYAQVFLEDPQRDSAVSDTFDILWLWWKDALASADTRRFAWRVLRATVMARTPHFDGWPEFGIAAFDTVVLHRLTEPGELMNQVAESLELFKAMSRLPDNQLDVMVLRHQCGFSVDRVSALLGVPPATVRSDERHAVHYLESVIPPPPEAERNPA
ncbi:sigma-70 family RNA polymerase sigma factor [Streptomyces griseoviridis]|nr:sigma-70 family RNA polymerase sigma factor [Streptomyces griseoviridis]